ncbi:MAG TPA: LPXTG cell wall anchor domain-containing protein [Candidatus Ligilactobacillus avistercoris]|nr:LPXTG cell wall anchor domain-containing protein [Candidatus Ligilactobacillus avistercoris]
MVIPDNKQAVKLTVRDTKKTAASSSSRTPASPSASSRSPKPASSSKSAKQPLMSLTPAAEQGSSSRAGSSRSVQTEGNSRVTSRSARMVGEHANGRAEVAKRTTSAKSTHRAGLPDTGDQTMSVLIVIGMVVLAGAGMIAIRRR